MELTRYEFGGIGIFHALDILENMPMEKSDEEDLRWAEREFDKHLEIPSIKTDLDGNKDFVSYFTREGLETFSECLDILVNLFYQAEDIGLGMLEEKKIDSSELVILYKDKNQVIAKYNR